MKAYVVRSDPYEFHAKVEVYGRYETILFGNANRSPCIILQVTHATSHATSHADNNANALYNIQSVGFDKDCSFNRKPEIILS